MSIVLVGLNHKTAPVEVRERLAFTDEACADSLRALVDGEVVREGLIVSTCNRVEVLAAAAGQNGPDAVSRLSDFLSRVRSELKSQLLEPPGQPVNSFSQPV